MSKVKVISFEIYYPDTQAHTQTNTHNLPTALPGPLNWSVIAVQLREQLYKQFSTFYKCVSKSRHRQNDRCPLNGRAASRNVKVIMLLARV